jgi:hypothetical protein
VLQPDREYRQAFWNIGFRLRRIFSWIRIEVSALWPKPVDFAIRSISPAVFAGAKAWGLGHGIF